MILDSIKAVMKFRHKNYVSIAITVYTSVMTLYDSKGRFKKDIFLLISHVMRLLTDLEIYPGHLKSMRM